MVALQFSLKNIMPSRKKTKNWNTIDYDSKYKDGYLDIIVPKDTSEHVPVILNSWRCIGAFVINFSKRK